MPSEDAARIAGHRSDKIEAILGWRGRDEIIHRDDLRAGLTSGGGFLLIPLIGRDTAAYGVRVGCLQGAGIMQQSVVASLTCCNLRSVSK